MSNIVRFYPSDRPALEPGEYSIQVQHQLEVPGAKETFSSATSYFSVEAERYSLRPEEVQAVFPPPNSMGDHAAVLPHVILARSSLPWERQADASDPRATAAPWLALLVFHGDEAPKPETVTLDGAGGPATVIDVEMKLADALLPKKSELALLAHVREFFAGEGHAENREPVAVVIANRLPAAEGMSEAHLVSVEHRYQGENFNFGDAKVGDKIRFVSLKRFRFGCINSKKGFTERVEKLDHDPSTLRIRVEDQREATPLAAAYAKRGAVPLRHRMRGGGTTVSWYHGPLATSEAGDPAPQPPLALRSDTLLRYNPAAGMLDVSYAAAWELGRLMALESKSFSVALYNWKRMHARHSLLAELRLPGVLMSAIKVPEALPDALSGWIARLAQLEGVPFHYLVPDERLLPPESIRFFRLDEAWIGALLDGAYSIGRQTEADREQDRFHYGNRTFKTGFGLVTGVLIRSAVVSDWPGLSVDGYDDKVLLHPLGPTRRLSENVLLGLFEGRITKAVVHPKPEMLHFEVDVASLKTDLRANRTVDVASLATKLGKTADALALKMIANVAAVTFARS